MAGSRLRIQMIGSAQLKPRHTRILSMQRFAVLRSLYCSASRDTGRPPALPRF